MKISTKLMALFALVAPFVSHSQAQTTVQQTAVQAPAPAIQAAAPLKKLGFRLTQWKTIHSSSAGQAANESETLKKIGCEVVSENHGNHMDIKYRCLEWKSIKLGTDQLVNQWQMWCADKGMETVIMNPPATTQKPTVSFRLTQTRNEHMHNPVDGAKIVNTLKLVGCQVATKDHNGHTDVTFSCPNWITIELPSERVAHAWQKWFNDSGFETQHKHVR